MKNIQTATSSFFVSLSATAFSHYPLVVVVVVVLDGTKPVALPPSAPRPERQEIQITATQTDRQTLSSPLLLLPRE
jgi:hypothetical protein